MKEWANNEEMETAPVLVCSRHAIILGNTQSFVAFSPEGHLCHMLFLKDKEAMPIVCSNAQGNKSSHHGHLGLPVRFSNL